MEENINHFKEELDNMISNNPFPAVPTENIPIEKIEKTPVIQPVSSGSTEIKRPNQSIRSEEPAKEHIKTISKNIDDIIQIAYNKGLEQGYIDGRKDGRLEIIDVITEVLDQYRLKANQESKSENKTISVA